MLYTFVLIVLSGSVDGGATAATVPNLTAEACNKAAADARRQAPRGAYNTDPRMVVLCIPQAKETH